MIDILADAAPSGGFLLGTGAVVFVCCLLVVSAVTLVIVLVLRSRRQKRAAGQAPTDQTQGGNTP